MREAVIHEPTKTIRNRALALSDIGDDELRVFRRSAREEVIQARLAFDSAVASLRAVEFFEHAVDLECGRRGL